MVETSKLKPPPRSLPKLYAECSKRGLLRNDIDLKSKDKRSKLLSYIWKSHQIGRSIDRASILLVGSSGVGKSSTINHFFGLSEDTVSFAKTSDTRSETRTTTEYVLEMDSPDYETSNLRLGLVDTPGFNDTDGTKQDACNFYSIKEFYDKHMGGCKPNIVLILVKATDTRILGENSSFAKSLRGLKSLQLIDTMHPNVVAILTFGTSVGESKPRYTKNIIAKKNIVKNAIFESLNIHAPVVALENEYDDVGLEKAGDFTILPDGTRQVDNLYEACKKIMVESWDSYGHFILNKAYDHGDKNVPKVTVGKQTKAKDAKDKTLSKEEYEFFEFFSKALEGANPDPLVLGAKEFISDEQITEFEKIDEIQTLVGSLKKIGVQDNSDLKFLSTKGLRFKHPDDVSGTGEKFLTKIGVKNTTHYIGQDSAGVIAQGYNILNDTVVPSQIFSSKEKDNTKYGIAVPKGAQLTPVNKTQEFMFSYASKSDLIQARLAHLNVSLDVDVKKFNFSSKAGFNLTSSKSTNSHSQELSFYMEERLFELSFGNFKSKDIVFTEDFLCAAKELPASFDVEAADIRSKFKSFFDNWGHFVVTKAIGGGSVELKVNSSSFGSQFDDIEVIKASITAAFSSGFFKASGEGASGSSQTLSSQQILQSSKVTFCGGARELHNRSTIEDGHKMDIWRNSLITEPTMLETDMYLTPISTLVREAADDPGKGEATYAALTDFLGGKFEVVAKRQEKEFEAERKRKEKEAEEEREKKAKETKKTEDPPVDDGCITLDSNVVVMRDGLEKALRLQDVLLGDLILGYDTKKKTQIFTKLIMWAHVDLQTPTKYIQLGLEDGSEIKLTGTHLIMVGESHRAVMARDVEVGNLLYKRDVGFLRVKKITQVTENGFCCPITESGNIMVEGVLTSCYAGVADITLFGKMVIPAQTVGQIASMPYKAYRKIAKCKGEKMGELDTPYHPYVAFLRRAFCPLIKY